MGNNRLYLAVGEETTRGTKQAATVGFLPLDTAAIPKIEFSDIKRKEFRGEDSIKGDRLVIRQEQKWAGAFDFPFFTEAGSVKGMMGTLLKHFFGHVISTQNGATGQYAHIMYPIADPFDPTIGLGMKALTMNFNLNQGTLMKNWPFVGGRVKSLTFDQQTGHSLKLKADMFGQFRDTVTAEIGSPVFAAENLRCDYNELKVYTGTITRIGTTPDYTDMPNYTDMTFGSAVQLKPDKITVKIENGMADNLILGGANYPLKTRMGLYKVTLELTIDWEDPASGFSSVQDLNAWAAASSQTNFALFWDTGTQAGTGGNHSLIIDIPVAQRIGGEPNYGLDKDPLITLKYEGLYDPATMNYIIGLLLKNTATAL